MLLLGLRQQPQHVLGNLPCCRQVPTTAVRWAACGLAMDAKRLPQQHAQRQLQPRTALQPWTWSDGDEPVVGKAPPKAMTAHTSEIALWPGMWAVTEQRTRTPQDAYIPCTNQHGLRCSSKAVAPNDVAARCAQ